MGDRGNIAIVQEKNHQVWLYSHYGGYEMPKRLQDGIKAGKSRWNDESYLTKIIICHAIPQSEWNKETGYGISCGIQDNEHPINVVDIEKQRVFTMPESRLVDGQVPKDYKPNEDCCWTFEEYAAMEIKEPA